MNKLKVAILASTNATSSQKLIEATQNNEFNAEITCFITNRKDCGAVERAKKNNIEVIIVSGKDKTREEFDKKVMNILDKKRIDLLVLIGYMRILSKPFVDNWGNKTMNIHPSLLPAFAGGMDKNVHEEVLNKGVKVTGCTLHFITEEADEGPIIAQKTVLISEDETIDSLKEKVQKAENEIIVYAVKLYSEKKIMIKEGKVKIL